MAIVSYPRIAASTVFATPSLARHIIVEGPDTALLTAVVIGTGIHASRLSGGDATWTLLVQSLVGGAGLLMLLTVFASVSGAYLNPVVMPSTLLRGNLCGHEASAYLAVQVMGAALGVVAAYAMFGIPA